MGLGDRRRRLGNCAGPVAAAGGRETIVGDELDVVETINARHENSTFLPESS
jgi:hypothetical protein